MKFNGKMKNCIIRKCSKASGTGNVPMEDIANPDSDNMVSTRVAELQFFEKKLPTFVLSL